MITKDNFKNVLAVLGFEEIEAGVFLKNYGNLLGSQMQVDFNNEKLIYAAGITADRDTTQNFHQDENFVVFECVCQLLDRGYDPRRILLEPSAGADGRGQTNTYLDILVKDQEGKNYLIIECKTTNGPEEDQFEKAWRKVLHDGGQLFNYFQLFRTEHLCLYASDFVEGHLKRYSNLIILKDENLQYLEDTGKEGFRDLDAKAGQNDYFRVWKQTYEQAFLRTGIFEKNCKAYEISTKITRKFDELEELEDYQAIQKKYNEFATIMRQHNVGSHENAFDKLVNLFLAKIVDEESNKEDLKFNWKTIAFDDYYDFQDRLQSLYTTGMKKFLGEEVTYINENTIKAAFQLFKNDPDATRDKIIQYFREQKFYSNNDFAFLDVHNKELFLKNMAVLIKIVQMLQDIRLKTEKENQFLGDLFEGFLDSGVKQSEGQFFTPIPIVKFLISSLPIEQIVKQSDEPPMVIDYACGAGHFLNEVARCIRPLAEKHKPQIPLSDFYASIVGIEKEYRLSKVAKVSAFMYSQDDIKIVYGDALAENKEINNGTFKLLVANPPYSVKGFLETLTDEERAKFELYSDDLNLTKNNSIETFFIERAKQLLAPGGVCAIILPSSVLSNGSIYIACREIILKYFDLVAIAEFGSGTFGKTGTNTVTLFMRRKAGEVDVAEHLSNRVKAWMKGDFYKDVVFGDADRLDAYCHHCGIDAAEYRAWLSGGELPKKEIFAEYVEAAKKTTKYKNIAKKRINNRYTTEQKQEELERCLTDFIRTAEADKLYYYLLADNVSQPVLIMKSPTASAEIKQFLGYEWSGAKGSEGIKYLGQTIADEEDQLSKNKGLNGIQTPLFDPLNYDNPDKVNTFIRRNFLGKEVPEIHLDCIKYSRLVDMLDFSRVECTKAFHTNKERKSVEKNSKYEMVRLSTVAEIQYGTRIVKSQSMGYEFPVFGGGGETFRTNSYNRENQFVISRFGMSPECVRFISGKFFLNDSGLTVHSVNEKLTSGYLDYFLYTHQKDIYEMGRGIAQKNLDVASFKQFAIPLPPISVQQQIVSECEVVDNETAIAKNKIEDLNLQIEAISNDLYNIYGRKRLGILSSIPQYGANVSAIEGNKNTDFRYIRITDITDEGDLNDDWKTAKEIEEKYILHTGDLLFARSGATAGKVFLYDEQKHGKALYAGYLIRFRLNTEKVLPKFVRVVLKSTQYKEWVIANRRGTAQPNINAQQFSTVEIPVPPLSMQRQIVEEISALEAKISEAKAIIATNSTRKQAILDKYLK